MRGFFIAVGAAALIAAALCVPVRMELAGAVEPGSGRLCLYVRWLLLKTRIHFQLCLLDAPTMTALIRHGRALTVRPLLGGNDGEKPKFTESLRRALRIKELRLLWYVGVQDDPAATAILGGILEQAGRTAACMLLPETVPHLKCSLQPCWGTDVIRLSVRGIATAFPAQIIRAWLKKVGKPKKKKQDRQK